MSIMKFLLKFVWVKGFKGRIDIMRKNENIIQLTGFHFNHKNPSPEGKNRLI